MHILWELIIENRIFYRQSELHNISVNTWQKIIGNYFKRLAFLLVFFSPTKCNIKTNRLNKLSNYVIRCFFFFFCMHTLCNLKWFVIMFRVKMFESQRDICVFVLKGKNRTRCKEKWVFFSVQNILTNDSGACALCVFFLIW